MRKRILFLNCNNRVDNSSTRNISKHAYNFALSFCSNVIDIDYKEINDMNLPLFVDNKESNLIGKCVNKLFSSYDAFALFTCEYHGSITAVCKNMFEYLEVNSIAYKLFFISVCLGGKESFNAYLNVSTVIQKLKGIVFPQYFLLSNSISYRDKQVCNEFDSINERLISFFHYINGSCWHI